MTSTSRGGAAKNFAPLRETKQHRKGSRSEQIHEIPAIRGGNYFMIRGANILSHAEPIALESIQNGSH